MARAGGRISVILPAYHSADRIGACLEALRSQTCGEFETIVVNSSPADGTRTVVKDRFEDVVYQESAQRLLPDAARNRGAGLAGGDLLVFSDPDCVAAPDWLERLVAACTDDRTVVQGSMGLQHGDWLERGIHISKWFALLPGLPDGEAPFVATSNLCTPRAVWRDVGPFEDNVLCSDVLFGWRAAARGYRLRFERRAVVAHRHGHTLGSLWRERVHRGAEFTRVRARYERWSRARAAVAMLTSPLVAGSLLLGAGRAAARSGWLRTYVATLPVQITAHVGWSLGHARACGRLAVRRAANAHG